jgi:small subunit ribosomal protein S10
LSSNKKVRMRLRSYDHRILDVASGLIIETAKSTGARIRGPVPLPRKIKKVTVLRSPHIDKKARDQLERRTFGRILEVDCTEETLQALVGLNLASEVGVEIAYI